MTDYDRHHRLNVGMAEARAGVLRSDLSAALADSPRPARPGRGVDHWLLFSEIDGRMQITGCQCGFDADLDSDCGYGDSVVQHLLEVGVTWRAKCSCGWKCWGKPTEVERLTREHDDSPNGDHIVVWDVPGIRPWSREMEAL